MSVSSPFLVTVVDFSQQELPGVFVLLICLLCDNHCHISFLFGCHRWCWGHRESKPSTVLSLPEGALSKEGPWNTALAQF